MPPSTDSLARPGSLDVSVVVVSYNSGPFLEICLSAIGAAPREVVVVDSGSTDGGVALVRDRFPAVEVVALERNAGYGSAANAGLARTTAPLVLVANADAWPVDDALDRLVARMVEGPDVGACAPSLAGRDGVPQAVLVPAPSRWWPGTPAFSSRGGKPLPRPALGRPSFLVGTALLLRRSALDEVGAFDERFFMFSEDVDLSLRLVAAGWRVELVPDARFVHAGGGSTGADWPPLYVEQVRAHLRLLGKHQGATVAARSRRYLRVVLRLRARLASGEQREAYRRAAAWLGSAEADADALASGSSSSTS